MEFLRSLEESGVGLWVRESPSLFAFTGLIALHAFGLAFAAGMSSAISLRILGVARELPLAPMEKLYPVIWTGFSVAALSGVLLLIGNATGDFLNPIFYIKMAFVVLGAVSVAQVRRRAFRNPDRATEQHRMLAMVPLAAWTGAIIAGKMCEYPSYFHF